jgi:hypothetical protein
LGPELAKLITRQNRQRKQLFHREGYFSKTVDIATLWGVQSMPFAYFNQDKRTWQYVVCLHFSKHSYVEVTSYASESKSKVATNTTRHNAW